MDRDQRPVAERQRAPLHVDDSVRIARMTTVMMPPTMGIGSGNWWKHARQREQQCKRPARRAAATPWPQMVTFALMDVKRALVASVTITAAS